MQKQFRSKLERLKILRSLQAIAKRKNLTIHRTAAGLICRKDGRIVKQTFSPGEMESYLCKQE